MVNYSRKDSELAVATDSNTASQLPITINGPPGTYILSSGEIFYTVDSQYTQVDPYYPILATPNVDEALDQVRIRFFVEFAFLASIDLDGSGGGSRIIYA